LGKRIPDVTFDVCENMCATTKGCTSWSIAFETDKCYTSKNPTTQSDAYEIPVDGEVYLKDVCAVMGKNAI
jgi:hypothetical protein